MKEAKKIARSLQQKMDQFGYVCISNGDMEYIRIALQVGGNDIMSHNEDQALIDIMDCGNVAFDKVSSDIDKGVKLGHCQEVIAQMGGLNGWNSVAALKQDDKPEDRTHLLKPYYVTIKEDEFNGFTGFECQAEDDSHAREQAENAYPAGKILSVKYLDHQHRYVPRGGLHCPCCGSDNISGNEWNADAGHATQEVGCDNCNAQWLDEYTLTGVIVQDGGDGTPGDSPDLSADDKFVCVNCGKTGDIEDSVETDDAVLVCLNCQVDVISNTEDWQQEVQNSDTKLGFAEWMMHRRESLADDAKVPAKHSKVGILAKVRSDDGVFETEFDATEWFQKASDDDILNLSEVGWDGDYAADSVAIFYDEKNPDIAEMFRYLNRVVTRKGDVGFECHVDAKSAMAWLKRHRNGLWARILCQENNVSLVEAQEDEIRGMWDWISRDTGNACEISFNSEDDAALDAARYLNLK